jgi:hypothetical protein
MITDDNRMCNSDELDFWSRHIPDMKAIGYQPPPEPPASALKPDPVSEMSPDEYARNRANLGMPNTGEFVGIPATDMNEIRRWNTTRVNP